MESNSFLDERYQQDSY